MQKKIIQDMNRIIDKLEENRKSETKKIMIAHGVFSFIVCGMLVFFNGRTTDKPTFAVSLIAIGFVLYQTYFSRIASTDTTIQKILILNSLLLYYPKKPGKEKEESILEILNKI